MNSGLNVVQSESKRYTGKFETLGVKVYKIEKCEGKNGDQEKKIFL